MLGTGLGTVEGKGRGWWARGKGPQVFKERSLVKKEACPQKIRLISSDGFFASEAGQVV